MIIKHTDVIGRDFFENRRVCVEPVELALNEECYIVDQNIIDTENETYGIIPCIVVRIDESPRIPGRKYYMFQAHESKNETAQAAAYAPHPCDGDGTAACHSNAQPIRKKRVPPC